MSTTLSFYSFSQNPNSKPNSFSSYKTKTKCNNNNNNNTLPVAPWLKTTFVQTPETTTPRLKPDNSLTDKVSGARGKKAMKEILRGIDKLDKTRNNPDTNLDKDESFSRVKEKMPTGSIRCNVTVTREKEKPVQGFDKMENTRKNPDGNLDKDESFSRVREKMLRNRGENGSNIQGIGKMDKTENNPDENLDKGESFSSVREKMPWEWNKTGSIFRKGTGEKERIVYGIDKMDKTRKNPDGNLVKDASFGRFGEKMPWGREELVMGRSREENDNILRGIWKMDKTENNPDGNLGKDESFSRFGEKMAREIRVIGEIGKIRNSPVGNSDKDESFSRFREKMPWEGKETGLVIGRVRREKKPTAAELSIDREVLKSLKGEAAKMRVWIKVNKAGVTQDVVDQVMITWRDGELAMIKFEVPLKWNMGRAREIVENKTGGLVVWTKNDTLVVYRGCNYKLGLETSPKMRSNFSSGNAESEETAEINNWDIEAKALKDSLFVREADRLLEGLGPRFTDWWSAKPLPVDGDLLPEIVHDFKPPSRLCPPHHARAKLSNYELTYLRKLARPLPTHFVLGRNRKLQGLAAAIMKLWEKCHIVKIALRWGAMNMSNEEMANELKDLTGGVLLLRNKFIIIIYRGKDFLPCGVLDQVVEREIELREFQLEEETARSKAINLLNTTGESCINSSSTGTLSEYQELQSDCAGLYSSYNEVNVQLESEKERLEKQLRNQERKLLILQIKIKRSWKELAKLNSSNTAAENDTDQEMISKEERECFRKIGLESDSSLLLGRRGVFQGVIEGIYQHWKHREVAKVITMQRLLSRVVYTAKQLESETRGILVSVDKLKEGYAIILYRGKNHKRPHNFVSPNLLTKREALSRSLEMQRNGSLKFFAYQRQKAISELKCQLVDLEKRRATDPKET